MQNDVVAKKSCIEGKGVFAARDFKKGETVVKWGFSRLLSIEQANQLPENQKKYVAYFNGKLVLMQFPAKYVNHSCNANTRVKNFCDVATRDIKKGEEITADYADTNVPGWELIQCNCGSKNCRGKI